LRMLAFLFATSLCFADTCVALCWVVA
jgi:hypothetical protein